jgi:hypothetical protein
MPKTYTYSTIAGLNKALRRLPKDASVELRAASEDIAGRVAQKAEGRLRMVGGVAKYVPVKVRRDRVPVIVMGGTTRLPGRTGKSQTVGNVMWGADFGSDRHAQFSPWVKGGRGLFPAVEAERDYIMDTYGDALMDAVDKAARRTDG